MFRSRSVIVLVAVVLWVVGGSTVSAAEVGLGLRAGTQGVGAELGVGFTEWFTLRGGIYGLSVSGSFEEAGIDYDGDVTLGGYGVLADFHPFRGGFRVSAGIFANENEIELLGMPTTAQEIGGTIYTPAEIGTLSGLVEFDDTAPYLGIGWGNVARGKRVGFLFDLGVLAQGSGEVSLAADGTLASDPGFQADLAAEAREVEDDISDFDLYPVISLGLSIRF